MHRSGLYGQNVTGEALGLSGKKKTASVIVENVSECEKNRYLPYGLKAGTAFAEDVQHRQFIVRKNECYIVLTAVI